MFPIIVDQDDDLGVWFLKIEKPKEGNIDTYFQGVSNLQTLLRDEELQNYIKGFYLSYWEPDLIRFSFFTNKYLDSNTYLDNRFKDLGFKRTKKDDEREPSPETYEHYCQNGKANIQFRRYLQLITNIGLELLYGNVHETRIKIAKYRLKIAPIGKGSREYFEDWFGSLSYFRNISSQEKEELLEGLDFWYSDWEDWAHMLVVMLLPGDWLYSNRHIFQPRRPLPNEIQDEFFESLS